MPSTFTPKKKGIRNTKKAGRKKTNGRSPVADSPQSIQREKARWKQRNTQLLLALASRQGEAYDAGAVVMALRVLLQLMDEATDLRWDPANGKMKGLYSVYCRASELTQVSVPILKERFLYFVDHGEILVSDNAIRGRGSPNCDRTALRKLTPAHDAAIKAFIDHRNSSQGAGKVLFGHLWVITFHVFGS
jgi:hypothetical protein